MNDTTYDVGLRWNNQTQTRPFPSAYQVSVTSNDINRGTVYGSGTYYDGTAFTLYAKSKDGYVFEGWYNGDVCVSTVERYTLTTQADLNLTAKFGTPDQGGGSTGGGGAIGGGGSVETPVDNSTVMTGEDGSSSVTTVDDDGKVTTQVSIPVSAIQTALTQNANISLPMPAVSAVRNQEDATAIIMDLPAGYQIKVEIPVKNVTPGTVALITHPDGKTEISKTCTTTEQGLVLTVYSGVTVKILDQTKSFVDVSEDYWGKTAIDFVTSRVLFTGVSDNSFAPEASMTRAMVWTVLASLDSQQFSEGNTWYEKPRQWAMQQGLTDGTSPDGLVTREQLVLTLMNYARIKNCDVSMRDDLSGFQDQDSISDWATEAVSWAVATGLLTGKGNDTLDPGGSASRAEVAAILRTFCQNILA